MERKDRKALAAAVAVMLVLGMSTGANALTIASLSWFRTPVWNHVTSSDLSVSFANFNEFTVKKEDRYEGVNYFFTNLQHHHYDREDCGDGTVPEPSAALVFGLGLLVASRFHRRKR